MMQAWVLRRDPPAAPLPSHVYFSTFVYLSLGSIETLQTTFARSILARFNCDTSNMPGRISARSSTASGISHKSSAQTLSSRRTTTPQTQTVPEELPGSVLRTQICSIFGDAQKSTAGHRKLVVSLRKVQEACVYQSDSRGTGSENDFNAEVVRCVIRLMGVKKSEPVGDKLVRFIGFFLRFANEKGQRSSCSGFI